MMMLPATEMAEQILGLELTTDRLRLRRLTTADETAQIEHEMNPAIMGMIRDPSPRDEVVQRLQSITGPWHAEEEAWVGLALEERATGEFIGLFFFRVVSYDNQSVELGYRLHPEYWRRGYATEAGQCLIEYLAKVLRVRKVVAYCVAENAGSVGVMENLGLVREGCLKQHSYLGGKWCDELVYGRILNPAEGSSPA